MEFDWSEEQAGYRSELRAFLEEEIPDNWADIAAEGLGGAGTVEFSRSFCATLAERGWLTPHWPAEHGGQDAGDWHHFILSEEMWSRGDPRGPQLMNINYIGPTIMKYGTDEQKRKHLPPMARGEAFWCQGYSEPEAGTDLVSLRTSAIRDGDHYVVNGQKIWTSYADVAQHCILLVRTDPESTGHKGISVLLCPMGLPGITVEEIPSILGQSYLTRVIFDEVRVPVDCRLGPEHDGWSVVQYSLQYERTSSARYARDAMTLDAIAAHAAETGKLDDPLLQQRIGEARALVDAARILTYRIVDQRDRGEEPSVDVNMARIAVNQSQWAVSRLSVDVFADGMEYRSSGNGHFRSAIQAGIAAGSWEMHLNQVSRWRLDLPREPKAR